MASASASVSLNAVLGGFSFGFGFVIFFMVGFGLGFGFPEFGVWLPLFNRRFDRAFIHFTNLVSISIYLQATLFASIRSSRDLCLSAPVERLFSVAGKVFRPERNRLSDELSETLMVIRCDEGDM